MKYPLNPAPDGYCRLYRVDNTRRSQNPVEGLTGRWFSDNPVYIDMYYARPGTQWTYVDVPNSVAESSRYEVIVATTEGEDLFGVEGKDFILPQEWVDRRILIDRPDDLIVYKEEAPFPLSEITSNVAKPGKVLHFNRQTGDVTVVEELLSPKTAVLLTKNRNKGKDSYRRQLVPIRQIKTLTKKPNS